MRQIPALLPRGAGHQFVLYGDACSGIPGALHERTFAAVNEVVRRLSPAPEFILFPGDEVIGLTPDPDQLRAQWRHWLTRELSWLDRDATPMYHATGNHTTYDEMSEGVFREILDLPRNGPPGQEGLSYWVRRGDLLMVFIHTLWSGLGGEGHVETGWLRSVLHQHGDACHKLVVGHHPVHPVNGFSGAYQREVGPEHAAELWDILVETNVLAYVCSHMLAFDVQVHRGVLQICTAGAGTAHRLPEGVEYLHCVQAALDAGGLRYQVLDTEGTVRERLAWPVPPTTSWRALPPGHAPAPHTGALRRPLRLRLTGRTAAAASHAQTLICAFSAGTLPVFWIGLRGPRQRLTAILGGKPGRSPHYWHGPALPPDTPFDLRLLIHPDMGPGGLLYALGDGAWSSLAGASATGAEMLDWPARWGVGCGQGGPGDRPFAGSHLEAHSG